MPSDFDDKVGQGGKSSSRARGPRSTKSGTEMPFSAESMEETSVSRPSLREMDRRRSAKPGPPPSPPSNSPPPSPPPAPPAPPSVHVSGHSPSDSPRATGGRQAPARPSLRNTDSIRATGVNNFAALIGKARKNLNTDNPTTQGGGIHLDLKRARDEAKRTNQKLEENEGRTRHQLIEEITGTIAPPPHLQQKRSGDDTEFIPTSIADGSTEALFGFKGSSNHTGGPSLPPSAPSTTLPPTRRKSRSEKSMIRRINELAASDLQEKKSGEGRRGTSGVLRLPESAILEAIAEGPPGPYRIRVDDLEYGPTDSSVILKLVEKGLVTGADEISKTSSGGWQRLESHSLFINYLERPFDEFLEEDSKIDIPSIEHPRDPHQQQPQQPSHHQYQAPDLEFPDETRPANASYSLAQSLAAAQQANRGDFNKANTLIDAVPPYMVQNNAESGAASREPAQVQGPLLKSPMRPPSQQTQHSTQRRTGDFTEVSVSDIAFQISQYNSEANEEDKNSHTIPGIPPSNDFIDNENTPSTPPPRQVYANSEEASEPEEKDPRNRTQLGHQSVVPETSAPQTSIADQYADAGTTDDDDEPTEFITQPGHEEEVLAETSKLPPYAPPVAAPFEDVEEPPHGFEDIATVKPGVRTDTLDGTPPTPAHLSTRNDRFETSIYEGHEPQSEKSSVFMWVAIAAIALVAIGAVVYIVTQNESPTTDAVAVNDTAQPTEKATDSATPPAAQPAAEPTPSPEPTTPPTDTENLEEPAAAAEESNDSPDAAADEGSDDSAAIAIASQNGGDSRYAERLGLLAKLAKDPKNQALIDAFDASVKEQSTHPPKQTEIGGNWTKFKQVGSNPTVYRTQSPDGTEWDFTPEHEKGPTWRGAYAFYQLCSLIDCGFTVPEARIAFVAESNLETLAGDNARNLKVSKGHAEGVLTKVIPGTLPFQIEDTAIWRNWLSRRTPLQTLQHPLIPLDINGGSDETRTALAKTGASVDQVAEGVANILAADYLTNNFGRFARHRSEYGQNVRFLPSAPFIFIAIDNDDAFQARESTRVRGRFNWSDRIGKEFVDSIRRLKPEFVSDLLFPNITAAEKAAMSVFWEQRSDLLNTIDRRVDSYGSEAILF